MPAISVLRRLRQEDHKFEALFLGKGEAIELVCASPTPYSEVPA